MPSSQFQHVSDVLETTLRHRPKSVIDIGCGYGRWGILFREILDVLFERYEKRTWLTQIDAVEAFPEYLKDYHRHFYNHIYESPVQDLLPEIVTKKYDMVFAGDIIEHLDLDLGKNVVLQLKNSAQKLAIFSVPLGDWPQGAVLGNEFEIHRATWTREHIEAMSPDDIKFYSIGAKDDYAVFCWGAEIGRLPQDLPPGLVRRGIRKLRKLL